MTVRISTGLRNAIAGSTGFSAALLHGVIDIYSGPQPLTADSAAAGVLLGQVSVDAGAFTPGSPTNGLTFDAPAAGTISKAAAENWKFTGLANGTAGWFRFKGNATDNDLASTTLVRMDGTCGTTGADLNLSNLSIVTGSPNTIDAFDFTIPAQ
jgi:hypothetical protein